MSRAELLSRISGPLRGRRLVWFGTRGDDVEAVADLPELAAAFSIIAPYRRRSRIEAHALEELTGLRVDLDVHDIDAELQSEAMATFRRLLFGALAHPSVLFTYRPSTFLSAVSFARRDRCRYLGLFKDHQAAFEHKPWVETAVAELGLPHIPWTYVADEDQLETLTFLDEGPVMLRRSRTNGGVGLVRLDEREQLAARWPHEEEAYVSVAPFISGSVPLNVGAVAWHDGVTVHPASIQLIGVPELTMRPFGYCGNDFGAAGDLEPAQLDAMEDAVVRIGSWLRGRGYLGAFGVDFLLTPEGVPLFTEVNPRFQGSTHASCQLSVERGESCLLLEHLAALLGLDAPRRRPLREQVRQVRAFAHFVVHSPFSTAASIDVGDLVAAVAHEPAACRTDVVVPPTITTAPGATVARVTVRDRLTTSGFELRPPWVDLVQRWTSALDHQPAAGARARAIPR